MRSRAHTRRGIRPARVFSIAVILASCVVSSSLKAMSGEEAALEAEQRSCEDAQAGRRFGDTFVPETSLRGRLYAQPDVTCGNSEVLGVFVVQGRAFQLKAGDDGMRRELLKRIGQDVWLEGEVRNEGKYFIARRFAAALPPAVALRDRKGL